MKHGGGADFRLMQETELYVRVHGQPGRTLGTAVWDSLQHDCKTAQQLSIWRHSVIKTMYIGPEKLISPAEIKKSLGPQLFSQVCRFELVLKELKSQGSSLPAKDLSDLLVKFEMQSVLCLLGKRPKECDVPLVESLEEAAHGICVNDFKLSTSPWAEKVNSAVSVMASSSTKKASATMEARSGVFVFLGRGVHGFG